MKEPKYRKHSNRDYAFVEFKGVRHRLPGRYGSAESKSAYHAFLREHVYGALPPPPQARLGGRLTVDGMVSAFLAWARPRYAAGNRSEYQNLRHAAANLVRYVPPMLAHEFGPISLKEVQRMMAAEGRKRSYINDTCRRIRRIFKWAVSEELIGVDVWQRLTTVEGLREGESPASESQAKPGVPWEDVEAVLPLLAAPVAAMVKVQWYTGARGDSIVHAMVGQFTDLDQDVWLWKPKHKERGRHELILPIGPRCREVLAPFMGSEAYLFNPRDVRNNRRYGIRYTPTSYYRAVIRAQERAGVKHWTPHQLRHSLGQRVRERHGVEAAQSMLGHASIDATQLYSQRRLEIARKIAIQEG